MSKLVQYMIWERDHGSGLSPMEHQALSRIEALEKVLREWRDGEYGFGISPTLTEINEALDEPDWVGRFDKAT